MAAAKRRGHIIKCCGYSKCDPASTGTKTNNKDAPNKPKHSRNNNTAAEAPAM